MATQNFPIIGPWAGIEERESAQTDQHCEMAINVDFSRGYIEGRDGFEVLATFNGPTRPQVGIFDRPAGDPRVFIVGPSDYRPGGDRFDSGAESHDIYCVICTLDGTVISTTNLTASYGEPPDPHFRCSFIPTLVSGNIFAGIITTKHQTYLYDPSEDADTIRLTRMSKTPEVLAGTKEKDPRLESTEFLRYWASRPKGSIALKHSRQTYYAGFIDGDEAQFTDIVDASQNAVDDKKLLGARDRYGLGSNEVYWSDLNDDLGIPFIQNFTAPEGERITGLANIGTGKLLVLTTDSMYFRGLGTSLTSQNTPWHRVAKGKGCTSPHAIESIGNVVVFLGTDGIYSFDGQQVNKLSKPIDSLWTGNHHNSRLPDAMASLAKEIGYPFTIATDRVHLATSVHVRSKNQIWFFVPLKTQTTTSKNQFPLCIVFDYIANSFSFFCSRTGDTLLWDAVSYISGGKEIIIGVGPAAKADVPVSITPTTMSATLSEDSGSPVKRITVTAAAGAGNIATNVDGTTITTSAAATPVLTAKAHAEDLEANGTIFGKVSVWATDDAVIHIAPRSSQKATLVRYGGSNTDPDGKGIPVIWQSARHFKQNEETITFRHPRYRMLAWGKTPSDSSVKWFMEGEQSPFDSQLEGTANSDRQASSGKLSTHPAQSNSYFFGSGYFPVIFTTSTSGGSGAVVTNTNANTPLGLNGGSIVPNQASITIEGNGSGGVSTAVTVGGVTITTAHAGSAEATATAIQNACRLSAGFAAVATAAVDGTTVTFTVKTAKATHWAASDWFTSRIDPGPVSSKWCQLGFVDDANASGRAPAVRIQEYSIEVPQTSRGTR